MYDRELVLVIFRQIDEALTKIEKRFAAINDSDDFLTETGMEKLDAICMQFIAVGESLKEVDKITQNTLLPKYPQINWKGVKGFRDIISHHYFDIDSEEVFWICSRELTLLRKTVAAIISDLEGPTP